MRKLLFFILLAAPFISFSQNTMTPELLWKLGRVSALGVSKDKQFVVYSVSTPDIAANKSLGKTYVIPINGGYAAEINNADSLLVNDKISADGKYIIRSNQVKLLNTTGADAYADLPKSNAYIYTSLNYRHWDE